MRRINFLIPTFDLTQMIVIELQQQSIPRSHLHVVANMKQPLNDLPQASIWQRSELASGLIWGTVAGAVAGLLGSLLTILFPPGGVELGLTALLISTIAGAGIGATILGLIKGHEHNHHLNDFKHEIEHGEYLLMVDVPKSELEHVSNSILKHHPEANIKISDPH